MALGIRSDPVAASRCLSQWRAGAEATQLRAAQISAIRHVCCGNQKDKAAAIVDWLLCGCGGRSRDGLTLGDDLNDLVWRITLACCSPGPTHPTWFPAAGPIWCYRARAANGAIRAWPEGAPVTAGAGWSPVSQGWTARNALSLKERMPQWWLEGALRRRSQPAPQEQQGPLAAYGRLVQSGLLNPAFRSLRGLC